MVFGFSKKKARAKKTPATPMGSPGKRAYAIGDIHGRLDLLKLMLEDIRAHYRAYPADEVNIVFLGDLIDRGPDSRGVIEHLLAPPPPGEKHWFIKGNHEEALARGLRGEAHVLVDWLKHGGHDTAESYGIERGALAEQPAHALEYILSSSIPSDHIDFLSKFLESIRFGDYLFVHAGVRPGVALEQQSGHDLRWIRQAFLNSDEDFGCVVVHGHTVTDDVVEKTNRIGLDTGGYRSGVLSCLWIEDDKRGFLQVRGAPDHSFAQPSH